MFSQRPELTAKLHTMRQAEIRAEFARYHLIQQATQGRPSGASPRLGALLWSLRSLSPGLWWTGYGREATSDKVPA